MLLLSMRQNVTCGGMSPPNVAAECRSPISTDEIKIYMKNVNFREKMSKIGLTTPNLT
jgi:hypothetical protein